MSEFSEGVWVKGKKTITGHWRYNWAADSFTICLDQKDSTTGRPKMIVTRNDTPEFNGWKLQRIALGIS